MDKIGNGSIPLRIGNLINTTVYGGPYREVPGDMFGVKMAVEIAAAHDVNIPTEDFNVPQVSDLTAGVVKALMAMMTGRTVYAGCWGGIGRTGIFLAALVKVQIEYRKLKHRAGRGDDPVLYVRQHFMTDAVETDQQMQFIEDFDVSSIVTWLDATQVAMGVGGVTSARVIDDRPIDADCVTVGDGSCVAADPCMHTPESDRIEEADLSNKGVITPIYDAHENIPPDYLDGNVQLKHSNHRAQWKQRHRDGIAASYYEDTDSADEDIADTTHAQWLQADSLQNQIDELQEQVDELQKRSDLFPDNLRISGGRYGMDAFVPAQNNLENELTKQSWYETIKTGLGIS